MLIKDKVVMITGASEGVGAALATEFAACGARLSLVARNQEKLRRAASYADPVITAGDITHDETRRRAVDATLDRYGAIDILVNNAGVGMYQPSWEMPLDDARYLFELNFFAPLALTQLVVPHMRQRRSGMIVNVGSIAGKIVLPWLTIYSVTKYALGALTEGQRMELRRDGIHTMIVCPGYVLTRFQQNVRGGGTAPDKILAARSSAITAEQCAAAIRRGVERDARTVVTPRAGWLLILAMRLFPALVESKMAAMTGTA